MSSFVFNSHTINEREWSDMTETTQPIQIDKIAMWAWTIWGVIAALFIVGLVIVSFFGGPFESDSYWRQKEAPAYPN